MKRLVLLLALAIPVAAEQRTITVSGSGRVQLYEIQTANFMIEQPFGAGRQSSDSVVRNSVTVTRHERGNISELLQAAVDAGANTAGGVRFFVADDSTARDRALELAYRDARARAEKLAAVAGRSLGDAITITTERPAAPFIGQGVAGGVAPPIESGLTTIAATLYVTFELK